MELSPEDERHIQNLSLIPTALVIYLFIAYAVYLTQNDPSLSPSFFAGYFSLVFLCVFPIVFFATEQVLRSRREMRPLTSYTKRFAGNIALFALGGTILGVVWVIANLSISSLVDWSTLMIVIYAITITIWAFIVFRFRHRIDTLSKGNW
jgi:cytochrome c biogenesis protein CcdA